MPFYYILWFTVNISNMKVVEMTIIIDYLEMRPISSFRWSWTEIFARNTILYDIMDEAMKPRNKPKVIPWINFKPDEVIRSFNVPNRSRKTQRKTSQMYISFNRISKFYAKISHLSSEFLEVLMLESCHFKIFFKMHLKLVFNFMLIILFLYY